jgi:hypothetical protein
LRKRLSQPDADLQRERLEHIQLPSNEGSEVSAGDGTHRFICGTSTTSPDANLLVSTIWRDRIHLWMPMIGFGYMPVLPLSGRVTLTGTHHRTGSAFLENLRP